MALQEPGYTYLTVVGVENCIAALRDIENGSIHKAFIEISACTGSCIGGAGCLTHGEKNKAQVDAYSRQAMEKTIADAVLP